MRHEPPGSKSRGICYFIYFNLLMYLFVYYFLLMLLNQKYLERQIMYSHSRDRRDFKSVVEFPKFAYYIQNSWETTVMLKSVRGGFLGCPLYVGKVWKLF